MKRLPIIIEMFIALVFLSIIPMTITLYKLNDSITYYVESEIAQGSISNLNSIETIVSIFSHNIYREAINYSMIDDLEQLRSLKSYEQISYTPSNIIIANNIYNNLKNSVYSNLRIHSVYLYQKDTDFFITTAGGVQRIEGYIDHNWLSIYHNILSGHEKHYWKSRQIPVHLDASTSKKKNFIEAISFFYPLTLLSSPLEGVIVINIYPSEIQSIISNSYGKNWEYHQDNIFIIDNKGTIITHNDFTLLHENMALVDPIDKILSSSLEEGFFIKQDEELGERMIFSYKKSHFNDWIFISTDSMDYLTTRLSSIRLIGIISLFTIMIAGTFIVLLIYYKIYSPVTKLAKSIRKTENEMSTTRNEAILISDMFIKMSTRQNDLQKAIERSKGSVKTIYLESLLKGNLDKYSTKIQPPVQFLYHQFIVVSSSIDNREEVLSKTTIEQKQLFHTMVLDLLKAQQSEKIKLEAILLDWGLNVFIINIHAYDSLKTNKIIEELFTGFQQKVQTTIGISISFGVGTCREGLEGISSSYHEAQRALKRKLIAGKNSIIFWRRDFEEQGEFFYPYQFEKHILNFLSTNDLNSIKTTIYNLITEIRKQPYVKYDNVIHIFNQLVGSTVKYLLDSNINISDILEYNIYHRLSEQETLEDIEQLLFDFYSHICEVTEAPIDVTSHSERVLMYIHDHYKTELDFEKMAEDLGISYSYIRKIVRETTSKSTQDYVCFLKIEETKRLLLNSNMTIREIADEVGFSNVQSLTRFFKKFNGITPSEFRNVNRKKD